MKHCEFCGKIVWFWQQGFIVKSSQSKKTGRTHRKCFMDKVKPCVADREVKDD